MRELLILAGGVVSGGALGVLAMWLQQGPQSPRRTSGGVSPNTRKQ